MCVLFYSEQIEKARTLIAFRFSVFGVEVHRIRQALASGVSDHRLCAFDIYLFHFVFNIFSESLQLNRTQTTFSGKKQVRATIPETFARTVVSS